MLVDAEFYAGHEYLNSNGGFPIMKKLFKKYIIIVEYLLTQK